MKKHTNSPKKSESTTKRAKSARTAQRETKEMLADLAGKLRGKLEAKTVLASAGEERPGDGLRPNLNSLTVGVGLGDQWSSCCILGLEGETLTEGQLRTRQQDVAEFFRTLTPARVVIEVGTHSAWVREAIAGCGHEVLVANVHPSTNDNFETISTVSRSPSSGASATTSGLSQ